MENREHFGALTPRMQAFREEVLEEKPYVEAERAVLVTEAYRAHPNQPRVMMRALMLEKILIEQLIAGPDSEGLLPVCYPDVIINSVLVEDDICTIDFNSRFNEADAGITDPELSLYAFVNTITDALRLDGVVIRIDGSTDVRFRSQVSLDQVFKKNYAIVEESEDEDRDAAADGQGDGGNAQAGQDAGDASGTDTRRADNDSAAASADALVGIVQGEQETE